MLLAIDVGNTNTTLGLFDFPPGLSSGSAVLVSEWRLETRRSRPGDEYALALQTLLAMDPATAGAGAARPAPEQWKNNLRDLIDGAIVVSVVPETRLPLAQMCRRWLGFEPREVGVDVVPAMPVLTDQPSEVGADRLVNAVAAHHQHTGGVMVVDFGTATTFDVVSPRGEFLGGAIAPGVGISAGALHAAASKLPKPVLKRPALALGKDTQSAMQSGLYFGYLGLVEELIGRICDELDFTPYVLATGGIAPLFASESPLIHRMDDSLTLRGLALLHEQSPAAANPTK